MPDVMCPVMSFWATLIFKRPCVQFLAVWLETIVINFPMALCWQIFSAGRWCSNLCRMMLMSHQEQAYLATGVSEWSI